MSGFRISISALLSLTMFSGLIFGALRSGATIWFQSIYTLTFVILLFAAIAARYRGAFWYGFAIVGWAYFVVGFGPWIGRERDAYSRNEGLLMSSISETSRRLFDYSQYSPAIEEKDHNRVGVCQIGLTVPLALVGGIVAVMIESRSRVKSTTLP